MTPAEVLNKAADLIDEIGWTQGEYVKRVDGKACGLCARGAIAAAVSPDFIDSGTFDSFDLARWRAYQDAGDALATFVAREPVGFNDYDATSASDVTTALRAAAECVA